MAAGTECFTASLLSGEVENPSEAATHAEVEAQFAGVPYICTTALDAKVAGETTYNAALIHTAAELPSAVLASLQLPFSAGPAKVQKLRLLKRDRVEEAWGGEQPSLAAAAAAADAGSAPSDPKRARKEHDRRVVWLVSPGAERALRNAPAAGERSAAAQAASRLASPSGDPNAPLVAAPAWRRGRTLVFGAAPPLPHEALGALLLSCIASSPATVAVKHLADVAPKTKPLEQAQKQAPQQKQPPHSAAAAAAAEGAPKADAAASLLAELREEEAASGKPWRQRTLGDAEAAVQADVAEGVAGGGALQVAYFTGDRSGDSRLEPFRNMKDKKCGVVSAGQGGERPLVYAEGGSSLEVIMKNLRGCLRMRSIFMKPSLYARHREGLLRFATKEHPTAVHLADKACLLKVLGYATGGGATQVAIVEQPLTDWKLHCATGKLRRIVALDGLGNAENVGSVIRSGVCFGAQAVLLSETCCSPWGRRAVRVSMGHVFSVPVFHCGVDAGGPATLAEAISYFRESEGFRAYAAVVQRENVFMDEVAKLPGGPDSNKWLVTVGAEHDGVSEPVREACVNKLKIRMDEGVDSLNVSIAAALLLHYFMTTLG